MTLYHNFKPYLKQKFKNKVLNKFQVCAHATVLLNLRHDLLASVRHHADHLAQRAGQTPRLLPQALRRHLEQALQRLRHLVTAS